MLTRLFKSRYARDDRGSILPIFALALVVLVGVSGAAVDYTTALMQRSRLSNALDAATLAVATKLSTTVMTDEQIRTQLRDVLGANLETAGYSIDQVSDLNYTLDPTNGTIEANAKVNLDTYILGFGGFGPEVLPIGVTSASQYSSVDVEIALVVDVTGSMSAHMPALKLASTALINELIPDDVVNGDAISKVRISLVPYSDGVNLGSTYAKKVKGGTVNSSYWDGSNCASTRIDAYPSVPAKYTDVPYDYWTFSNPAPAKSFFGGGTNSCSNSKLVPLTSNKTSLLSAVNAMNATGTTAGQTGIGWGWYTLSPNWSNLWPSNSRPAAYGGDEALKFMVLMTDGQFNRNYVYETPCSTVGVSQNDYNRNYRYNDAYTYLYRSYNYWSRSYTYYLQYCGGDKEWQAQGNSTIANDEAEALCDAMKDEGIQIYSVFFTSTGSLTGGGSSIMSSCASNASDTYFLATSHTELVSAFGQIAKLIQKVYISK